MISNVHYDCCVFILFFWNSISKNFVGVPLHLFRNRAKKVRIIISSHFLSNQEWGFLLLVKARLSSSNNHSVMNTYTVLIPNCLLKSDKCILNDEDLIHGWIMAVYTCNHFINQRHIYMETNQRNKMEYLLVRSTSLFSCETLI